MQDTYVTVNGVRLHCVTAGPATQSDTDAPLMMFLHGFPEFWYEWKAQLREFAKDHLVVAPDMRGYNLSDKPAEVDAYRVPALIEDIRGLADHFRTGKKFVLVAHDWGGALAWVFAMAYPEALEKLIIINAPHPKIFRELLASDPGQQQASQYMLLFRSPMAEAQLTANNYGALTEVVLGELLRSGKLTETDKAEYVKAWSQPGALTGGLNYYRASAVGPPAPTEIEKEIGKSAADFGLTGDDGARADACDLGRKGRGTDREEPGWVGAVCAGADGEARGGRFALGGARKAGGSERIHSGVCPVEIAAGFD